MKTGQSSNLYLTTLSGFYFDYSHHFSLDELTLPLVTTINYCLNGKQDSTTLSGFYFDYSHHLSLDELTLTSSN